MVPPTATADESSMGLSPSDPPARQPWWPLPIYAAMFLALLRFTAYMLGGELLSLQRDFQARESPAFWRIEPLAAFCVFPVSIYERPLQLAVLAGVMSATALLPLLMARLYGRAAGLGFLAAAAAFGSFPWLAAATAPAVLMVSSARASVRRSWTAAGFALMPLAAYGWLAVDSTNPLLLGKGPVARWAVYFPPLLGAGAALALGGPLLWAAALAQRAGRGWLMLPVAAALAGIPVGAFLTFIGRSELEFALLRQYHDPKVRFEIVPSRDKLVEYLRKRGVTEFEDWWDHDTPPEELTARQIREYLLPRMKRETEYLTGMFLKSFPDSPHAPDVLYYKALTVDTRFDEALFADKGQIRFLSGEATPDGLPLWRRLVERHGEHPLAAVARLRLAADAARRGEAAAAERRFDRAREAAAEGVLLVNALLKSAERHRETKPEESRFAAGGDESAINQLLAAFGFNPAPPYGSLLAGVVAEAESLRDGPLCQLSAAGE
jgi:hypothetical protein